MPNQPIKIEDLLLKKAIGERKPTTTTNTSQATSTTTTKPKSIKISDVISGKKPITNTKNSEAPQLEEQPGLLERAGNLLAPTTLGTVKKLRSGEDVGLRDIAGTALEVGSFLVPAGAIGRAVGVGSRLAKGSSLLSRAGGLATRGIGKNVTEGAAVGAASGALFGAGQEVAQPGAGITDVASGAALSGLGGGLAGGALGGAFGAIGRGASSLANRSTRKAEELKLLTDKAPDARVATRNLDESGRVVKDPVAKEAVRQGIEETDVALIKGSTPADKLKMLKMLDVREAGLTNKRITERATDVVGDTFIEKIAKPIEKLNREAGQELNQVAKRLAGKKVDVDEPIVEFANSLREAGITFRGKNLNFKDSNFEGLRGPQKLIKDVWKRAARVAKSQDALQAHRLKSYIDELVEYGKETEGLSGRAQNLLKQLRRNVDQVLDNQFPAYNQANTKFADTIQQLNNMGVILGRRFRIGDEFADAQTGNAFRRLFSNTNSRAEMLRALERAQQVASKYGIKVDQDIINQAAFADLLEKKLGSEASTSFLGQIERGTGGVADIASSGKIGGTIKAGKFVLDRAKGVSKEGQIKSLRDLLKASGASVPTTPKTSKPTVFGRRASTVSNPKTNSQPITSNTKKSKPVNNRFKSGLSDREGFSATKTLIGAGLGTGALLGAPLLGSTLSKQRAATADSAIMDRINNDDYKGAWVAARSLKDKKQRNLMMNRVLNAIEKAGLNPEDVL